MKNIFQKLKVPQVHKVVLGLALLVVVGFGVQQVVAQNPISFLTKSDSSVTTKKGSLGINQIIPSQFTSDSSKCNTFFTDPEGGNSCLSAGSVYLANLSVSQPVYFLAQLIVGNSDFSSAADFVINTTSDDALMATSLAYPGSGSVTPRDTSTETNLCVSTDGVLVRCASSTTTPPPALTYAWSTGTWGSCSGSDSANCSGTYVTTSGGSCSGTYTVNGICEGTVTGSTGPFEGQSCTQFGTFDECKQGWDTHTCNWNPTGTRTYTCFASNESSCTSIDSACTWNINSTTNSCSGPTTESTCTAQNSACTWNTATAGTQTRTIECKDSNGVTVANSFCTEPQPTTSQSC